VEKSVGEQAFLSFRLPAEQRARVKAVAAKRGESVQEMLGRAVATLLADDERRPPLLSDILKLLRGHKRDLQRRGLAKLWIFGSVVRGEAQSDSDIDLIVEFDPKAKISLTGVARLRQDLADLLAAPVDLAEWRNLRPHVRRAAENDAVQIF
jgi:predicted nucleotidyltransferase